MRVTGLHKQGKISQLVPVLYGSLKFLVVDDFPGRVVRDYNMRSAC
jgi:hypothetical protein